MSVAEPVETATEPAFDSDPPKAVVVDDLDDVEESLVEEISIDGMCGVY